MNISKGQRLRLSDITNRVKITASISIEMTSGEADVCCFGVDSQGKLSDDRYFIFYNQTTSPEQSIKMEKSSTSTDFHLDLSALPQKITKLVFTVTNDNGMPVTTIKQGQVQLKADGNVVAECHFSGSDFNLEKAIILNEIYNKDSVWRFSSILNGFNGGLDALLTHFGGEESSSNSSTQNHAPAPSVVSPSAPAKAPSFGSPSTSSITPSFSSSSAPPNNTAPNTINWSTGGSGGFGGATDSTGSNRTDSTKKVNPFAPTPVPIPQEEKKSVVSLKKPGETHKISLKKTNDKLHVNLNWNQKTGGFFGSKNVDLDLACLYILKDGKRGIVQALGNAFGNEALPPYIMLDKDDRSGNSQNGENMFFAKPETIELAVVFAYIYEGAASWNNTDGVITLKQSNQPDIQISLENSNSKDRFCVIATMRSIGGELEIRREEKYFKGHREIDNYYAIGLRWQAGSK